VSDFNESSGEEWKGDYYENDYQEPEYQLAESLIKALEELAEAIDNPQPIDVDAPAPANSYIIEGEIVRPAKNMGEHVEQMAGENRRIALDEFSDTTFVSTVFLGRDHSFGQGTPILFETMAWLNGEDYMQYRYPTYEAAMTGHRETVEELKIALANNL